jgi:hypothetical protein
MSNSKKPTATSNVKGWTISVEEKEDGIFQGGQAGQIIQADYCEVCISCTGKNPDYLDKNDYFLYFINLPKSPSFHIIDNLFINPMEDVYISFTLDEELDKKSKCHHVVFTITCVNSTNTPASFSTFRVDCGVRKSEQKKYEKYLNKQSKP